MIHVPHIALFELGLEQYGACFYNLTTKDMKKSVYLMKPWLSNFYNVDLHFECPTG